MRSAAVFCVVLSAMLTPASFIFTPVPEGLTEPMKYRLLMTRLFITGVAAETYGLFHPHNEYATVQMLRRIRGRINYASPSEIEGSNIRSTITDFDGVRIRLYQPITQSAGFHPALIFIHGGGFALGSADSYDRLTRHLAERLDMVIASIDYRLAPEHPFPTAYNDCLRATRWFLQHAEDYRVNSSRIGILGDSAGGALSAGISQGILDDDSVLNLKLQILIYPSTQSLDFLTPSYQKYDEDFGNAGILPRQGVATFASMYLYGRIDTLFMKQILSNQHLTESFRRYSPYMKYVSHDLIPERLLNQTRNYIPPSERTDAGNATLWELLRGTFLDPRWAPLFRQDFTGLPPAFILTCGFDSIRDDGIFYARRLEAAGVETTWRHYDSAFHGVMFLMRPFRFAVGDEMERDIVRFVRENI